MPPVDLLARHPLCSPRPVQLGQPFGHTLLGEANSTDTSDCRGGECSAAGWVWVAILIAVFMPCPAGEAMNVGGVASQRERSPAEALGDARMHLELGSHTEQPRQGMPPRAEPLIDSAERLLTSPRRVNCQ